jgi:hypothetical protein
VDLNGTQAAIRAGYSADSARSIASENLTKPNILAAVDQGAHGARRGHPLPRVQPSPFWMSTCYSFREALRGGRKTELKIAPQSLPKT